MIVLLANQKGGAGKSTITLLLANYLNSNGAMVNVIDMDYQQSITAKFEKSNNQNISSGYEIVPVDLGQFPNLLPLISKHPEHIVIIDLPGKMDDDGLIPVLASGELILCPFNYDELTVNSTVLFIMVIQKINPRAKLIFIPNKIKSTVKYETREQVDNLLSQFGSVLNPFPDRIDFQSVDSHQTPIILLPIVNPIFDIIYERYLVHKQNL